MKITTSLMPQQKAAVAKVLPSRAGGLLMDMGTGKSLALAALASARSAKWDRLIWVTPCALRDNVVQQLRLHTDLAPEEIYRWDDRTRAETLPLAARVHVVGMESMSSSTRVVSAFASVMSDRAFVAVDESAGIKGWRAKRSQRLIHMSEVARYRLIMTGTPITQGAVDLYAQMRFLSPRILGYSSFWGFARNHLEYEERRDPMTGKRRKTGRIIRVHNADYLASKMAPYVYQVRKDECLDLPNKLYETRYLSLTQEQRHYYDQAKREILLELAYDDWSPIKIFHLYTCLQTIVLGWWNRLNPKTLQNEHIKIHSKRLDVLMRTLEEIPDGEHVVIWAKYHEAIQQITQALEEDGQGDMVHPYHGAMSDAQRAAALSSWRARGGYLVATQACGGHGLTLIEASYSVFYADTFKYSDRIQAEDRTHRIGQVRRPVYISMYTMDCIDARIERAMQDKGNALDEFQQRVEQYRALGMKDRARAMVEAL